MRISDEEVKRLVHDSRIVAEISALLRDRDGSEEVSDEQLVREVTEIVVGMPDREDMIAEIKARIDAGTYNPTGDEIAETMIRRAIADRIR